jgi:hypothetical protein
MTLRVSWRQALAWRMERQLLAPVGTLPVEEVVRRLGGVQAQVASSAELAVRVRQASSRPGEVAGALADGRVIKTWAMRGTLHLLHPADAGAYLSLLAAGRSWERPAWVRYFGMEPRHWEAFREAAREALDGRVLSRDELIDALVAHPALRHLEDELRSGWGTLLKPLAWQGDLCFGPSRGTRVTFTRPDSASAGWAGVPDPEEAAPTVIVAYYGAYGPATIENLRNWIARGRVSVRSLRRWVADISDRLTGVEVDGEPAYMLAEHVDALADVRPTTEVRMLPGFDQYVLGPGTEDAHVVPAAHRWDVSRQSGWIAPVVVAGGAVGGTWEANRTHVAVRWFPEAGRPPLRSLRREAARISKLLGRELELAITPS